MAGINLADLSLVDIQAVLDAKRAERKAIHATHGQPLVVQLLADKPVSAFKSGAVGSYGHTFDVEVEGRTFRVTVNVNDVEATAANKAATPAA